MHHDGQDDAVQHRKAQHTRQIQDMGGHNGEEHATPVADPSLFGRDRREKFLSVFLSQGHSEDVGTDIGTPDEHKERYQQHAAEMSVPEGDQVGQGQRDGDINQTRIQVGELCVVGLVFYIQRIDHHHDDRHDGQRHIFDGHLIGGNQIDQGKQDHTGQDSQRTGDLVAVPHRNRVKLRHHAHHHEDYKGTEKPLAPQ